MKTPSILLLSPFFYPEQISTGKYNTHLSEELVARGCEVKVIASHPLYPSWKPKKSDADLSGMKIIRGGAWLRYPGSALFRRIILELWYTWHVLSEYVRNHQGVDCVIPVFPPSLCFFLLIFFLPARCRKIGIVHDLQGVYAGRSKGLLSRVINGAIHLVEKRCFANCDRLIFLSYSMLQKAVVEYGLEQSRCTVCYPFVALNEGGSEYAAALSGLFDSTKVSVVYSGALGDKQNPDGLLAFFHELEIAQPNVECHVFSSGPHFERLRSAYCKKTSTVKFHDLVPTENLVELYTRSDVQIIPQALGTADGSLPSKLPNLMAAGVPIFVICETGSELAELVIEARAGYAAYTWDAVKLTGEFTQLLSILKKEKKQTRCERLNAFVRERFSVKNVVDEIVGTDSVPQI